MEIKFTECNNANNILKDFAKFNKVSDYLQCLLNDWKNNTRTLEFYPLDCAFEDDGKWLWIIRYGEIDKDAQKNINKLKKRRVRFNKFISDYIVIHADSFESELFISWYD